MTVLLLLAAKSFTPSVGRLRRQPTSITEGWTRCSAGPSETSCQLQKKRSNLISHIAYASPDGVYSMSIVCLHHAIDAYCREASTIVTWISRSRHPHSGKQSSCATNSNNKATATLSRRVSSPRSSSCVLEVAILLLVLAHLLKSFPPSSIVCATFGLIIPVFSLYKTT